MTFRGVWPTMVTPFTGAGEIDYEALGRLVDWYIDHQVDGLFAVCQSSEMFWLSLKERIALAQATVDAAGGRVPVIASGHVSDGFEAQVDELSAMADTGVAAVVWVTNRLATPTEPGSVWRDRAAALLDRIPERCDLGLYECPYPYKRILEPESFTWCLETDRFAFLKDTCLDLATIAWRGQTASGSRFRLFNAHAASLLHSLRHGYVGFSGVMANFHPELCVRLVAAAGENREEAETLQALLGCAARFENSDYPVTAKYAMRLHGLDIGLFTRSRLGATLSDVETLGLVQLKRLIDDVLRLL